MMNMDLNQLSELATAIMDSWATSNSSGMVANSPNLGVQSPEQVNKIFGTPIKHEIMSPVRETGDDFPGVVYAPGYGPSSIVNPPPTEQVPMDDYDPLAFWDSENFYCHQDYDQTGVLCDVQMDNAIMPPLPEYLEEDTMTREEMLVPIKDANLPHNPTLAELNSCNDNLVEFTTDYLAEGSASPYPMGLTSLSNKTFIPSPESHFVASPISCSNSPFSSGISYVPNTYVEVKPSLSSSCPIPTNRVLPNSHFLSTCDEKFLLCPQNSPASDSFFPQRVEMAETKSQMSLNSFGMAPSPLIAVPSRMQENSLLSSSAPPDIPMASYLKKIKSEPMAHSPGTHKSSTERSLSGFSSLSLSNDDESGSFFDDTDDNDDFSSDEDIYQYESDDQFSTSWPPRKEEKSCQHRKHRYFWQYNLQSRGSKSQNLLPHSDSQDPHVLNDAFDPVFSEECALPVKHSGKARRGDGNDLTPNPCKLFNIGIELKKLNKLIYNITPNEPGVHSKPLSRKEKNKLASRVCRLKKKAQHEANKIKLYGLQQEHKRLIKILIETKELLRYKIENMHDKKLTNCSKKLENFVAANEPMKVAGNTASFVNHVLERIAKGECDGGLGQL